MNIFNPIIPLVPNPIGIVKQIQALQINLGTRLQWLTHSYGIATTGGSLDGQPAQVPEAYDGTGYVVLTPNDRIPAHSFFKHEGPAVYTNYNAHTTNSVSYTMSLIVLMDLDQIKELMEYEYQHRFTQELRIQIQRVLNTHPRFKLLRVSESPRDVFDGYTYNNVNLQTFRHPYAGFKFTFSIGFLEECLQAPILVPELVDVVRELVTENV